MNDLGKRCRWLFGALLPLSLTLHAGYALAIECYDCHGSRAGNDFRPVDAPYRNVTTGGFQGNHRTHMDEAATPSSCTRCHSGASEYDTGHRNAVIDVSPNINDSPLTAVYRNGSTSFPQRPNPRLGSCSNVNCHFERETPVWGGSAYTLPAGCLQCHGAPPDGGDAGAAGSHAVHDSYYPGLEGCARCHYDHLADARPFSHATSAGRTLGLVIQNPFTSANGFYDGPLNDYLPGSSVNSFGSCSNVYCHSSGASRTSYIPNSVPVWGTPLPVGCTACHSYPPSYANGSPKANSHPTHSSYSYSCEQCHRGTTATGSTITDKALHVNYRYDVSPGNLVQFRYSSARTGGTCYTASCHNDGTGIATGTIRTVTVAWGESIGCSSCHGEAPTGRPAYPNGSPKANMHTDQYHNHDCSTCHYSTTATGTSITNTVNHVNGAFDVTPESPLTMQYSFTPTGGTCINTSCHTNPSGARKWGADKNECDGCHESPPNTTSHLKHFSGSALQARYTSVSIAGATDSGYLFNCANCHSRDITKHRDGVMQVELYDPAAPAGSLKALNPPQAKYSSAAARLNDSRNYSYSNGTCSNVYCHSYNSFTTPNACIMTNVSTQAQSLACDNAALASLTVTRVYRDVQWNSNLPGDCSGCHANGPRSDYTTNDGMTGDSHSWIGPDGFEQGHFQKWYNYTEPVTCNYCHNDTITSPNRWSKTWGYDQNGNLVSGFINFSAAQVANFGRHVNGKNDVKFDTTNPYIYYLWGSTVEKRFDNAIYDIGSKTCSNVSCHSDGFKAAKWGSPYRAYVEADAFGDKCQKCHYGTGPNTTITSKPSNPSRQTDGTFKFTASEAGATFQCSLDNALWSSCVSPYSFSGLMDATTHTFGVRATDTAGNTGSAASYAWTVNTNAPMNVKILSTDNYYLTLYEAIAGFGSGTQPIIVTLQMIFNENLVVDRCGEIITLGPSYIDNFATLAGPTSIAGGLTIRCGTVIAESLLIQ